MAEPDEKGWVWSPEDRAAIEAAETEARADAESDAKASSAGARRAAETEAKSAADVGDWKAAREALARAIDADPNAPELHAQMAWYTSQLEGVLDSYEKKRISDHHLAVAFEIDPGSAEAHYYKGLVLASQGSTDQAKRSISAALHAKPDFAPARRTLERLEVQAAEPAARTSGARPAVTTRKTWRPTKKTGTRVSLVVLCLAVSGAAVWLSSRTGGTQQAKDMATRLGTQLKLVSATEAKKDLYLNTGPAWYVLAPPAQAQEMRVIATGAKKLGFDRVFLYSGATPVGEAVGEQVCVDLACMTAPGAARLRQGAVTTGAGGPAGAGRSATTPAPAKPAPSK